MQFTLAESIQGVVDRPMTFRRQEYARPALPCEIAQQRGDDRGLSRAGRSLNQKELLAGAGADQRTPLAVGYAHVRGRVPSRLSERCNAGLSQHGTDPTEGVSFAHDALDRLESDRALIVVDTHAKGASGRDQAFPYGSAEVHQNARSVDCRDDPEQASLASVRQADVHAVADLERCPSEIRPCGLATRHEPIRTVGIAHPRGGLERQRRNAGGAVNFEGMLLFDEPAQRAELDDQCPFAHLSVENRHAQTRQTAEVRPAWMRQSPGAERRMAEVVILLL